MTRNLRSLWLEHKLQDTVSYSDQLFKLNIYQVFNYQNDTTLFISTCCTYFSFCITVQAIRSLLSVSRDQITITLTCLSLKLHWLIWDGTDSQKTIKHIHTHTKGEREHVCRQTHIDKHRQTGKDTQKHRKIPKEKGSFSVAGEKHLCKMLSVIKITLLQQIKPIYQLLIFIQALIYTTY